ncbi:protein of unknown function [Burkholderia multivorans]
MRRSRRVCSPDARRFGWATRANAAWPDACDVADDASVAPLHARRGGVRRRCAARYRRCSRKGSPSATRIPHSLTN